MAALSMLVPRLLVAEDEPATSFALSTYFTAKGWCVVTARSVEGALEELRQADFDVAILDLRLGPDEPDGGLRLAQDIAVRSVGTRTILLTAYGSKDTEARAYGAGIDIVLDKPTRLAHLADVARRLTLDESPTTALRLRGADCS